MSVIKQSHKLPRSAARHLTDMCVSSLDISWKIVLIGVSEGASQPPVNSCGPRMKSLRHVAAVQDQPERSHSHFYLISEVTGWMQTCLTQLTALPSFLCLSTLWSLFLSSVCLCRSDHLPAAAERRHGAGSQREPAHFQQGGGHHTQAGLSRCHHAGWVTYWATCALSRHDNMSTSVHFQMQEKVSSRTDSMSVCISFYRIIFFLLLTNIYR